MSGPVAGRFGQEAPKRLFILAGEPSGDALGGPLLAAMATELAIGRILLAGVGGAQMEAAGLRSFFPMTDLSVMGLAEVLPRLPVLAARLDEAVAAVEAFRPDVVLTIDAPDFSFRLHKRIKARGLRARRLHLVAPTVWAWRPGRARKVARLIDHLLVLLPFEPPYFEAEGLRASFVGHPAATRAGQGDAARFRAAHGLASEQPLLLLLPGSRAGELKRHLPLFLDVAQRAQAERPDVALAIPTLPHLEWEIRQAVAQRRLAAILTHNAQDRQDAFAAATAALACSGTVALELALDRVPHVVVYKMANLTFQIARRLVRAPHISLANLILGERAIPELIQNEATPEAVLAALVPLLDDPGAAAAQRRAGAAALQALGGGGIAPAERMAAIVRAELGLASSG